MYGTVQDTRPALTGYSAAAHPSEEESAQEAPRAGTAAQAGPAQAVHRHPEAFLQEGHPPEGPSQQVRPRQQTAHPLSGPLLL